jgi:hypothetical protein
MTEITREKLHAYLDDALTDQETAQLEQALRGSEPLRRQLRQTMLERDRGDHSLGAVWRRERLTCPTREQLGSYLLQVLDDVLLDYIEFHLRTVACPFCQANLADLKALQNDTATRSTARRRRFYESSAGFLHIARESKK